MWLPITLIGLCPLKSELVIILLPWPLDINTRKYAFPSFQQKRAQKLALLHMLPVTVPIPFATEM